MARDAGSRMSSLFAFGNSERSRSKSPAPRTLLKSRDESPKPQAGLPAQELRASRSTHNLGVESTDHDGRGRQSLRLSTLVTDVPPPTSNPLDDDVLIPPPSIAGFGGDRVSSPTGSNRSSSAVGARPASSAGTLPGSRPGTPGGDWIRPLTPTDGKLTKRMSWFPGKSHSRNTSAVTPAHVGSQWAFVVGPQGKTPYDTTPLLQSQPIPEIWDEQGNMFVHFQDKANSRGPSFKLHSSMIASSKRLTGQSSNPEPEDIQSHMRQMSLSTPDSRPASQAMSRSSSGGSDNGMGKSVIEDEEDGLHLYLCLPNLSNDKGEITSDGLESLIRVRNLFAFLVGQVLVGTPLMPSLFAIFMGIASTLRRYEFTNIDGSSLGEAATASFLGYVEDLAMGDVRTSREKTMEALVLGERMKCWPLYNEAYVHAAGKWDDMIRLKTPVFQYISDTTTVRLEKSSRNLQTRLAATRMRLETFEFPSLFHGVLASSAASKVIDAKSWKNAFMLMRKHILTFYKSRYGQWPPKGKSKKNDFETTGLNRVVAQEMYSDFCDLYDMLVDRNNLTPRSVDITADDEAALSGNPSIQNLRKFMSEYDRSSPPVLPPVPYDLPLLPNLGDVRRDFKTLNLRKQVKERSKRVKDDDLNLALMQSYNRESVKVTPFLEAFMAFERNTARGKTFDEIVDLRIGQWMFLYVVLQSLPLLAMDAPGLRWTEGVEYFLCEPPKGSPPWQDEHSRQKTYYRVTGNGGVISLPTDVVDHGVEGVYFRSHCWQMASLWNSSTEPQSHEPHASYPPQLPPQQFSQDGQYGPTEGSQRPLTLEDLPPPPGFGQQGGSGSAPGTPLSHRSSMALGLEALPMPPAITGDDKATRRLSTPDPTKSFDAILGTTAPTGKKKR